MGFGGAMMGWKSAIGACAALLLGSAISFAEPRGRPVFDSGFADGGHAKARLVFGEWQADGTALLGVEMVLAPGWHTYWRTPGEAGRPPQFDWSGSDGARITALGYPFPQAFTDNGFRTHGHAGRVVYPVTVEAGSEALVALDLTYAVCADICTLEELSVSLPIDHGLAQSPHRQAVREAFAASTKPVEASVQVVGVNFDGLLIVLETEDAEAVLVETPNGHVLETRQVSPTRWLAPLESVESFNRLDQVPLQIIVRRPHTVEEMTAQIGSIVLLPPTSAIPWDSL